MNSMKSSKAWIIILALTCYSARCQEEEDMEATVTVNLRQGAISGMREDINDNIGDTNRIFYSFKGIPYAVPPVGRLRFRKPIFPSGWSGTRDGSVSPPVCPQLDSQAIQGGNILLRGEEDCLYLNIYTPRPYESNLPVMVWIHGGAFISGGAEEYAPMALLKRDIVLVSIQYRLGTLGFISTQDRIMPGNLGLMDQTMAIRWVKTNIQDFGGDPFSVTLIGQGAGAASAHFQVFTPDAADLFSRVILQSASALSPWVLRDDHLDVAYTIGQIYNCSGVTENPRSLDSTLFLYCLQDLSLEDLVVLPSFFTVWQNSPQVMTPRVDGNFLPECPSALLSSGRFNSVSLISGYNKHEGALAALPMLLESSMVESLYDDFDNISPVILNLPNTTLSKRQADKIFQFYLGRNGISLQTAEETIQMLSDANFKVTQDVINAAHAEKGNVFAYELQHRGQNSMMDLFDSTLGESWISHADDLQYLIGENPFFPSLERWDDLHVQDLILSLWTNFAATGYPTPDGSLGFVWAAASPTCLRYLAITVSPYTRNFDREVVTNYWRNLPLQRNRNLYPERFTFRPSFYQTPPVSTCIDPFRPFEGRGVIGNGGRGVTRAGGGNTHIFQWIPPQYYHNHNPHVFQFQKKLGKWLDL